MYASMFADTEFGASAAAPRSKSNVINNIASRDNTRACFALFLNLLTAITGALLVIWCGLVKICGMLSVQGNNGSLQDEASGSDDEPNYPKISQHLGIQPAEWTYVMRRSMQEIIHGLYLGPYSAATKSKLQTLQEHGITHIICVRQCIEAHLIKPNFPNMFKYLVLDIADCVTENIMQHFRASKKFIDDCLNSGGRILVHGNSGISRSASLVIAYLMATYGLNHEKAYQIIQRRRFCVNPNDGFMQQLREYEPIYRAERCLQNELQCPRNRKSKRARLEERPEAMDS